MPFSGNGMPLYINDYGIKRCNTLPYAGLEWDGSKLDI
jgi:hypothetical protein